MITAAVAVAHAFRTNKDFNPSLLYLGTLLVDFAMIDGVLRITF